MRIAVCEDIPAEAQEIVALLDAYGKARPSLPLSVTLVSDGPALLAGARESAFDLCLLDILLGDTNGIQLAEEMRLWDYRGQIVFLTNSPDYALPAFSVRASGYLLKPVTTETLFPILDEVAEALTLRQLRDRRQFTFHIPTGLCTVPMDQLIYVEVLGHTPYYHFANHTIRGSEMRVSFRKGMADLLESGRFLQPHRAFLVHAGHIAALTSQTLTMDEGTQIPIARTRVPEVRSGYLDYLMEGGKRL